MNTDFNSINADFDFVKTELERLVSRGEAEDQSKKKLAFRIQRIWDSLEPNRREELIYLMEEIEKDPDLKIFGFKGGLVFDLDNNDNKVSSTKMKELFSSETAPKGDKDEGFGDVPKTLKQ